VPIITISLKSFLHFNTENMSHLHQLNSTGPPTFRIQPMHVPQIDYTSINQITNN